MSQAPFGATPDGAPVELFTLTNPKGTTLSVTSYGAAIVSLRVPDRDGRFDDVVLGFDTLAGYLSHRRYFGAIIGRYANRIRGGRFTLDGAGYRLPTNDGRHHLHGGTRGFDKVVWRAEPFRNEHGAGLSLRYTSPEGEEGYPGTLEAEVRYLVTETDELVVEYEASTDAPTPVNLTQHSYFNLAGAGNGDVLAHELTVAADHCTPVDRTLIPTGEILPVTGTALDFRTTVAIGARIGETAGGYDHNFVLREGGGGPRHAARLRAPTTGRTLDLFTTEPGLQVYTGNFLDGTDVGKAGRAYQRHGGICLETQHFPDSPNQPGFPTTILRPGQRFRSRTVFRFGVAA